MNTIQQQLAHLMRRVAALENAAAPSAERRFFDNPTKKSVREFAESNALSNEVSTATKSIVYSDSPDRCVMDAGAEALKAPPPPSEIKENTGGKQFSTLNQFVVETKEPVLGLPQGHKDIPRAERIVPESEKSSKEIKQEAVKKVMRRLGYVHQ